MITKFRYFINEACDVVSLGNGKEFHYYREDNYAFLYFDGKMKYYRPLEDSQLYMDFSDNTHSQLKKHLSEDNDYSLDYVIKHIKFSGRIYLKSKIMAFWDYPNKKELMDIINDLEKATEKQGYPVKIWNNGWRVEIYNKNYHDSLKRMGSLSKIGYRHPDYEKFDVPEINGETKLIPVEWYMNYSQSYKPKLTLQQRQLMFSEKKINESKQLGFLYHVTTLEKACSILESNTLYSLGNTIVVEDKWVECISTTRNKNFIYDIRNKIGKYVQFVLDGDKISENYKIKSHDYWRRQYNVPDNPQTIDEDEESIIVPKGKLFNLSKYIIQINVVRYNKEDVQELNDSNSRNVKILYKPIQQRQLMFSE